MLNLEKKLIHFGVVAFHLYRMRLHAVNLVYVIICFSPKQCLFFFIHVLWEFEWIVEVGSESWWVGDSIRVEMRVGQKNFDRNAHENIRYPKKQKYVQAAHEKEKVTPDENCVAFVYELNLTISITNNWFSFWLCLHLVHRQLYSVNRYTVTTFNHTENSIKFIVKSKIKACYITIFSSLVLLRSTFR